ncbi:MAG: hypothetical protein JXX28_04675 [Deltaproteobacteria bacterium]|nr:hypothetical protein [Deltaproteobacteria bacterium]
MRWGYGALLAAVLGGGCWVNPADYWEEADYEREYRDAYCTWSWRCFGQGSGYFSREDCVDRLEFSAGDTEACVYDRDAAQRCVGDWLTLSCEAGEHNDFPQICDEVYDCP